ncbi:MAG TPA: hypothetical protein G4O05_01240 [Caldilineae bacterium]|nr:hypothetical protein [Caldilineae bacterium]HIQ11965.1 hypothetical protein [Caldilineales bacterium]
MIRYLTLLILFLSALLLAGCARQGATITWETASEMETAGFNLYRSESPDGPWVKINDALIPPSEDPVRGGRYAFKDVGAEPGKTYYYQLEEVELSGKTTRFPPIEMQSGSRLPPWPWWVVGAAVAVGAGWLLGSVFR